MREKPADATYYYRIVARNKTGTTYGKVQAYTKLPIVDAESASGITLSSATLKADIYPNFQQTKYGFEYATSEAALEEGHGTKVFGASELEANEEPPPPALCADGTQPTLSEGTFTCDDGSQPKCQDGAVPTDRENSLVCFDPVSANISGLEEHTTYYCRAIAENASSENPGSPNKSKPITATSAASEGEIDPGVSHEHFFEYGASLCEVTAETCGTVATQALLDHCSTAKNRSKSSVPLDNLRPEHDLSLLSCRCEWRKQDGTRCGTGVHDAWLLAVVIPPPFLSLLPFTRRLKSGIL